MIKLKFSDFAALLEEKQICAYFYDAERKQTRQKNVIYDERLFDSLVKMYGNYYVVDIGEESATVCCTLVHPDDWDACFKKE